MVVLSSVHKKSPSPLLWGEGQGKPALVGGLAFILLKDAMLKLEFVNELSDLV